MSLAEGACSSGRMPRRSPSVMGIVRSESGAPLEITGRELIELVPGPNDVRHLAPGVYFVSAARTGKPGHDCVNKVITQK